MNAFLSIRLGFSTAPPRARTLSATNKSPLILLSVVAAALAPIIAPGNVRAGIVYVSNYTSGTIEKFTPDGVGSLFATANGPSGMAFDSAGNLFTSQRNRTIQKLTPAGVGTQFADFFFLSFPTGLAFDGLGNLYAANTGNDSIVKFTPQGVGSYFAYGGLAQPYALAFDRAGNLYVSNDGVYSGGVSGTIVKITPGGIISVFATGLSNPEGLAFDSQGNLYVSENIQNPSHVGLIEKFTPNGDRSAFANLGADTYPIGLAFDSEGLLYTVDTRNSTILRFAPTGVGSVFAHTGSNGAVGIAIQPEAIPEPGALGFGLALLSVGLCSRFRIALRRPPPCDGDSATRREHPGEDDGADYDARAGAGQREDGERFDEQQVRSVDHEGFSSDEKQPLRLPAGGNPLHERHGQ